MKKFEIENHAPSFLPEGSQWKLLGAPNMIVDEPPFRIKGAFEDDAFIVDFVRLFGRTE